MSPADFRHFGVAYGGGIVQNLRAKPWLVLARAAVPRVVRAGRAARGARTSTSCTPTGSRRRLAALATRQAVRAPGVGHGRRAGAPRAVARAPARPARAARRRRVVVSSAREAAALGARDVRVIPSRGRDPRRGRRARRAAARALRRPPQRGEGHPRVPRGDRGPAAGHRRRRPAARPRARGGRLRRRRRSSARTTSERPSCASRRGARATAMVAREAMAYGRPVVATASAGSSTRSRTAGPGCSSRPAIARCSVRPSWRCSSRLPSAPGLPGVPAAPPASGAHRCGGAAPRRARGRERSTCIGRKRAVAIVRRCLPGLRPGRSPAAHPAPISAPTAIVHDWFQGFHGAERVGRGHAQICSARQAGHLTFSAARRSCCRPSWRAAIVKESRLAAAARHPPARTRPGHWRYLLPYMPNYFAASISAPTTSSSPPRTRSREQRARRAGRARTSVTATRRCATRGCRTSTRARAGPEAACSTGWRARCAASTSPARSAPTPTSAISTAVRDRIRPLLRARRRGRSIRPSTSTTSPRRAPRRRTLPLGPPPRRLQAARGRRGGVSRAPVPPARWSASGRWRRSCAPRCRPTSSCADGLEREELLELYARACGLRPYRRGGLRHHDGRGARVRHPGHSARPRRLARHRPRRRSTASSYPSRRFRRSVRP